MDTNPSSKRVSAANEGAVASAGVTTPANVPPKSDVDLTNRYTAARDALSRALLALRSRDEKIAELEAHLRVRSEELEDLGRELTRASSRLSDSHQSSCRLFDAYCSALPGKVLGGRFEIIQEIGSGGHGIVYQAVDRKTHREVALKLLRYDEDRRGDPQSAEGFNNFQLAHPNVAAILDTGTATEGIPFVAMELLRGRNLADVLQERGSLTTGHVVHIAHAVSLGLGEAHRWGVVHRDVKPSNVFLARVGGGTVVKVLDFGLAKVVRTTAIDRGPVPGTPLYVAPERLRREPYDARVDVYSLGVLIYEMLGVTLQPVTERASTAPAPNLHELRTDVPRPLSNLALSAIRYAAASRPTMAEMTTVLSEQLCYPAHLSELLSQHHIVVSQAKDVTLESVELARNSQRQDTQPNLKATSSHGTKETG